MSLGTTGQVIKMFLIVILIILLVIEFFTLFVGLAFVILPDVKKNLVPYGLFMVIVAGLLISLAFVGLCGAVRECYLKLFVFAGLLMAVLLITLLVQLFMLPPENQITEKPTAFFRSRRQHVIGREKRFLDDISNDSLRIWDSTHRKFQCCGVKGPISWLEMNISIPLSCCHSKDNSTDPISDYCKGSIYGDYVYTRGCINFQTYKAWMGSISDDPDDSTKDQPTTITLITIIRTAGYFIQLVAVILAIWLGVLILFSYHCGYY